MKYLQYLMAFLYVGSFLYAEPSVYGNSSSFASPQKVISQNKKIIVDLQRQIAQQDEQIEGLRSIVEGLSATVGDLKYSTQSKNNNNDNNALLHDLGTMIDKINETYVTKKALKEALGGKALSRAVPENMSTTDVYTEGVRLFVKKRFSEAKKRFSTTDSKGFKTAASNYYLGEIAYYTKQYEDAIFHFKKSAGINDKASYIDTLLLHTAIALENRGETAQAKAFYENIIVNYDGKKTASIAKDKLKKL